MNFYDLKLFEPVELESLPDLFKLDKCIKKGGVSVFEDTIGKPGDAIFTLVNVEITHNPLKIILEFRGDEKIVIYNPQNLYVNQKIIAMDSFERLEWTGSNFYLEYSKSDNRILTKSLPNTHVFNINIEAIAFLFYSW